MFFKCTLRDKKQSFCLLWLFALLFNVLPSVLADHTIMVPDDLFVEEAKKQLAKDFEKAADLKGEIAGQMEHVLNHLVRLKKNPTLLNDARFEQAYAQALKTLDVKIGRLLKVRGRIDENLSVIKRALEGKQLELAEAKRAILKKQQAHHDAMTRLKNRARQIALQYERESSEDIKENLAREFVSVRRAQQMYEKWEEVYAGITGKIDQISTVYLKLPRGIQNLRFALQDQFLNLELNNSPEKDYSSP